MEIWEVLKAVSTVVGPLAGVVIAVLGYFAKQQINSIHKAISEEIRERKVEFASMRGRMEIMDDEREAGDAALHNRLNDIEKRLPQEYARQGSVESLDRRFEGLKKSVDDGFRHQSDQLQSIMTLLQKGQ